MRRDAGYVATRTLFAGAGAAATALVILATVYVLEDASTTGTTSSRSATSGTMVSRSVREQLEFAYPSVGERTSWCAAQRDPQIAAGRVAEYVTVFDTSDGIGAVPGDVADGMAMFCEANR